MAPLPRISLLLDERPLLVMPTLARLLGLNHAIVFQQLHFWLTIKEHGRDDRTFYEGNYWVYNSYRQWRDQFPWWSEKTISRCLNELEHTHKLVISCKPRAGEYNQTKWYRIDYDAWEQLVITYGSAPDTYPHSPSMSNRSGQVVRIEEDSLSESNETICPDHESDSTTEISSEILPAHDFSRDGSLFEEAVSSAPVATSSRGPSAPVVPAQQPSPASRPVANGSTRMAQTPRYDVPTPHEEGPPYVELNRQTANGMDDMHEVVIIPATESQQTKLGRDPKESLSQPFNEDSGVAEADDFFAPQPLAQRNRRPVRPKAPSEDGKMIQAVLGWWQRDEPGYPRGIVRGAVDARMAKAIVAVGKHEGWDTDTLLAECQACYTHLFSQLFWRGKIHLGLIGQQLPIWYHQVRAPNEVHEQAEQTTAPVSALKKKVEW